MNKYGKKRAENKRLIQKHLDEVGLNGTKIAERAGLNRKTVSFVLNGHCHSPKVLEELRKVGVPEEYICDPRRAEAEERQHA